MNPDIDVLVEYIGDDTTAFVNDVKGEALSAKMYDDGAEIVYHAAGLSGAGLFRAAVDANKLAIGVDSDQYLTAAPEEQPLILTSMLKRVDTAVYDAIEQTSDDAFKGGFQVFGLDVEGRGLLRRPTRRSSPTTSSSRWTRSRSRSSAGRSWSPKSPRTRNLRRSVATKTNDADEAGRASAPPLVVLDGITKRFPGVVANDDVSLELRAGEVHALIGENGAGKSTLMRVLYGMYPADAGRIELRGQERKISSPRDAIASGIGMVHQHFVLVDPFTVTENVILGDEDGPILNTDAAEAKVRELAESYGFSIDPGATVEDLSVGEEQRVEILKALYRGVEILILDEPTAVLTPAETQDLFDNLRRLVADGKSIVFISHKLDEVLEIADRITVLRRGVVVGETTPQETDKATACRDDGRPPRAVPPGEAGQRRSAPRSCAWTTCAAAGSRSQPRGSGGGDRGGGRCRGQRPARAGRRDHGPSAPGRRHGHRGRPGSGRPEHGAASATRGSRSSPRTGTSRVWCWT